MSGAAQATTALVLAAGLGSRIREIAGGLPKPLMPFGGRPIVAHNLRWLAQNGIQKVWMNLHYRSEAIMQALGDGSAFGLSISYIFEPQLLGTAGALANIAGVFQTTMLVVYGDNLVRFDLDEFLTAHQSSQSQISLALFDQSRHLNTGIAGGRVSLDGAGRVSGFVEGGQSTSSLVNAGVYAVEPEVLQFIPRDQAVDFGRDVFPAMLASGRHLQGYLIDAKGYCLGLDTPASLAAGQRLLDQDRLRL